MLRHGALWLSLSLFISLSFPSAQAAEKLKDWTLLVYLNGHNNLDEFGAINIKQMEKVGSTDKVNVVVQWASMAAPKTKRLYITKSDSATVVTSPVVQELDPVDMGDPESLLAFVRWAKANYPARHYFIDIWNHGSGWHNVTAKGGQIHSTDISWDERFATHITTKQLGAAIRGSAAILGQKVDIYGSDACLMAMGEVAGEMKDSVSVFVGAQETEPSLGWPYDTILEAWNKLPSASPDQVGALTVQEYTKSYSGGENGSEEVTLSAFRMSEWARFESAFQQFSTEMRGISAADMAAALRVAGNTQSFYYSDYKDLFHFTEGLSAAGFGGVKANTLTVLQNAVRAMVVANGVTNNYRNSHGISIWLPDDRYDYDRYKTIYENLAFNQSTGWGQALRRMFSSR
jgi:hypothetical protein